MTEPSPRPWTNNLIYLRDANDTHLGYVCGRNTCSAVDNANAAHIVKCVNAHDRLVELLDGMCGLADLQNAFTSKDDWTYLQIVKAFLNEVKK